MSPSDLSFTKEEIVRIGTDKTIEMSNYIELSHSSGDNDTYRNSLHMITILESSDEASYHPAILQIQTKLCNPLKAQKMLYKSKNHLTVF